MPVLDQINNLLHSSDPDTQREANNYLTKWQRTIEAWAESHSILNGNYPLEAKFIASQTLRIKILYDFYQLPSDYFLKICESLLSYLNQDGLPRNISFTVGLAVCDMAIQMAESWDSPVESFINYYKTNRLTLEMVLFLLETLPEETSNNRLILTPELHTKVTFKLKSEYLKVVEFLTLIRNNLTQLTSNLNKNNYMDGVEMNNNMRNNNLLNYKMLGKILKVWNNWRRFDTFSSNGELCKNFLNDCLEIIKNPNLRNEGLEEETYETSVDCIVDLLQECSYLINKQSYGTIHDDEEYVNNNDEQVSVKRYNDLIEVQKACFNVLVREMKPHMIEAYRNRDTFLYNNLSRLFVNLVDSIYIDNKNIDPDLILLMDYLLKFIELPYLLLYNSTNISHTANPFVNEYNHVKSREIIVNFLNSLNLNNLQSSYSGSNYASNCNFNDTHLLDLDDEVCNISQKSVYILVDVLSKFSKSSVGSFSNVSSVNLLTTTTPGLFPYLLSNILQLLLLVTVPPYQLYLHFAGNNRSERVNYVELVENYNFYISEVMELYYELSRLVNKNALFDYFKANLLNLPGFSNNTLLLQSAFVLIPPSLSVTSGVGANSKNTVINNSNVENVEVVNHLVMLTKGIFDNTPGFDQLVNNNNNVKSLENALVTMVKINGVKFLGQVKRVFTLPDTHNMLKEVLVLLTKQLNINTNFREGTNTLAENLRQESINKDDQKSQEVLDRLELYEKLKYESGYSISLICYHIKMDRLRNNEEILTILLSSLENVDNELLIMILEGLATSCYNLNQSDLLTVFSQLINNTLNQLMNVIHSAKATSNAGVVTMINSNDKSEIMKLLNRIVGFVRNLKNRPELDPIVGQRIFPILLDLLKIFYLDNDLVEVICRCIKHNARVLDVYFSKYINVLVQTISQVAQVKMFGTYLYLIEWLHSIFYSGGGTSVSNPSSRVGDLSSNQNNSGIQLNSGGGDVDRNEIINLYNLLTVLTLNIFKKSYNNYPNQVLSRATSVSNPSSRGGDSVTSHASSTSSLFQTSREQPNSTVDVNNINNNLNRLTSSNFTSSVVQVNGNKNNEHVNDMDENELLIEDFYGLQAEFFLNSDNYLNDLNMVNEIINCSCRFLFIKRPQCVFYFWESLLKTSKYNQHISSLASQYLQTVLNNCFLILSNSCSKSTEHYIENLTTSVISHIRSSYFNASNLNDLQGTNQLQSQLQLSGNSSSDKEKYIGYLFANALSHLPMEIIGNDKLRHSFLNGLVNKTTSTINHIYKLLAKLSMRNRI